MFTHRRKQPNVIARQADNDMNVIHDFKGPQGCKKGDWLVGSERGKIEVFKPAAFNAVFEPIPDAPSDIEQLQAQYDSVADELVTLQGKYKELQEKFDSVSRVAHAEEAALDAAEEK